MLSEWYDSKFVELVDIPAAESDASEPDAGGNEHIESIVKVISCANIF
jgi:hypothetical protein